MQGSLIKMYPRLKGTGTEKTDRNRRRRWMGEFFNASNQARKSRPDYRSGSTGHAGAPGMVTPSPTASLISCVTLRTSR